MSVEQLLKDYAEQGFNTFMCNTINAKHAYAQISKEDIKDGSTESFSVEQGELACKYCKTKVLIIATGIEAGEALKEIMSR